MFVCLQARNWDENGNPPSTSTNNSSGSSVSFTARQLKPLSIYRHNPAFHSQHVSVNQCDEIPPLSPTALQPNNSLNSTTEGQENSDRMLPAKVRRKKKVSNLDLYPWQLINLDLSNFEYLFCLFQLRLPVQTNKKYSKFDTSKSMSYQGHKFNSK